MTPGASMRLKELLKVIETSNVEGDTETSVCSLVCDSRKVSDGALFFALPGNAVDGHDYIESAVSAGAAAVVLQDAGRAPSGIPWVQVADSRMAMARIAAEFYGSPTATLPLVGITGTNGKTTTTYLVEAIMTAAGIPPAVLGTISYRFGNKSIEASHTTPESTELQAAFRTLADSGAKGFVMEVSSHALDQRRVDGSIFDVALFTNLTRDHLDYHNNMEEYLAAKQRLFIELMRPDSVKPTRRAVVNIDDEYGQRIADVAACPVITFGQEKPADISATDIVSSLDGIKGLIKTPGGEFRFSSRLVGSYNLSNILGATGVGIALGIPIEQIKSGIEEHAPVPGRLERVENSRGVTCLVDYAHTGDALENVLSTLKKIATGRIITVFGCGGDRDRGKRPVMGGIAARYSDLAIVTSDNPRTEEPSAILAEIKTGIDEASFREYRVEELSERFLQKGFVVIENRREAIRLGAAVAGSGDILLLAGKGHEDYQIIGKTKHHFDDREEAASALAGGTRLV